MKKVTWMMIVILVVSCLTGCNTTEKALIDQLTQLVNWPYMSINFSGKIVLEDSMYFGDNESHKDEEVTINYKVTAYLDLEEQMGHFIVDVTNSANEDPFHLEGYLKEDQLILDKAFYISNYPHQQYEKLGEDYIGETMPSDLEFYFELLKSGRTVGAKALDLLSNEKVDIPLQGDGKNFTMNLDEESFSKASISLLKACLNHTGELYDLVADEFGKEVDATELADTREQLIKAVEEKFKDGQLYEMYYYFLKGAIYGSECETKMKFENNTAHFSAKGNLDYMTMENIAFDFKLDLVKTEKQALTLPKSLRYLSDAEKRYYDEKFYITFSKNSDKDAYNGIIEKNGKQYFSLSWLDYAIKEEGGTYYLIPGSFNSYAHLTSGIKSKELKNRTADELVPEIKCNPIEVDERYYLSKQDLEKLGFEIVNYNEETVVVYYNIPISYFENPNYNEDFMNFLAHTDYE